MSETEWTDFIKQSRKETIEELQARSPQLTSAEAERLATELETLGLVLMNKSIQYGIDVGFAQAKKAYKFSITMRTIFVTMLAPLFISVGTITGGKNFFGLFLSGVIAAGLFFIADEALGSLVKLLKKGNS